MTTRHIPRPDSPNMDPYRQGENEVSQLEQFASRLGVDLATLDRLATTKDPDELVATQRLVAAGLANAIHRPDEGVVVIRPITDGPVPDGGFF